MASGIRVEINNAGMREMYRQIAAKIEAKDRELRAVHTGQPVEHVKPAAQAALAAIGLNMHGDQLTAYAQSISDNKDFRFVLQ
jgi:hypothetical protein